MLLIFGNLKAQFESLTCFLFCFIDELLHRGRLTPLKMNLYKDELVFYIFYNFTRDVLQIHAAEELFNRHWRYHMGEELWINAQGVSRLERGSHSVKGMYLFFDPVKFLKEKKEFHLDCNLFEGRPFVPRHFV